MRATKIEIRAKALGPGRHRNGVWEPAGQLITTLWLPDPSPELAQQIAAAITVVDGEAVVATVEGREEMPTE